MTLDTFMKIPESNLEFVAADPPASGIQGR